MQYAWFIWSLIILGIWLVIFLIRKGVRKEMLVASLWTTPFGLTEPLFVPEYWNPSGDEICLPNSHLPRVVVIGGGFAGISLVKELKNKPVQVGIRKENIARSNRLLVDDYCRIKGYENIYAIGDIAAMVSDHYPSGHSIVAQLAIQQGKQLANNILLQLQGKERKRFTYKDKGSLSTIGKRKAVADLGKLQFGGYVAWLLWSVVHLLSISGFRNKFMLALN